MQQRWVTLLGTALAAIAFQSSAVRAQDRTYSIEGYQLSEHSVGVIRRADDQKNRGSMRWAGALGPLPKGTALRRSQAIPALDCPPAGVLRLCTAAG